MNDFCTQSRDSNHQSHRVERQQGRGFAPLVELISTRPISLLLVQPRANQSLSFYSSDFADEFPNAEVMGTDVFPIQPSWIPPNVKFEIEDCNRE